MSEKYLETVQNFHLVTCNKEGLPGRKLCFYGDRLFTEDTTLVVIKFSTTSKLSETLHNFMISVTIAVSNA